MVTHVAQSYEVVISQAIWCLSHIRKGAIRSIDTKSRSSFKDKHTIGDIKARIIGNLKGALSQYPVSLLQKYIDHMVEQGKLSRHEDVDTYKLLNDRSRSSETKETSVQDIICEAIQELDRKSGVSFTQRTKRKSNPSHSLDTILHQIESTFGHSYCSREMLQEYISSQVIVGTVGVEKQVVYGLTPAASEIMGRPGHRQEHFVDIRGNSENNRQA